MLSGRSGNGRSETLPIRLVSLPATPSGEAASFELTLARLAGHLRRARRRFRRLTGLTAVMSLKSAIRNLGGPQSLQPPVHPRCAVRLRTTEDAPCREQWRDHLRASLSSRQPHGHTCPLGLRCSCVPIHLGKTFVGIAKLVADSGTSASDFAAATTMLALIVSLSCHEAHVSVLQDELQTTLQRLNGQRRTEPAAAPPTGEAVRGTVSPGGDTTLLHDRMVILALEFVRQHHHEPDLSLRKVAAAVGCNPKYLTQLFTRVAGQRMHGYIVGLRVERACQVLLTTDLSIKRIAVESGFGDAAQMSRIFQRYVGVTPSGYRQVFAGR